MESRLTCSAFLVAMLLAGAAQGVTGAEFAQALSAKYALAKVSKITWTVSQPGTELVVRQSGMFGGDPMGMNKWIRVVDGQLKESGSGQVGGAFLGSKNVGVEFKKGDRVYIREIDEVDYGVRVSLITASTINFQKGNTVKNQHAVATAEFLYSDLVNMDAETALAEFAKWLSTEQEASQARTIRADQTLEEVEAILGPPEKRIDLGSKQIFIYADMKVIFVDGKVTDVE